MSILSDRHLNAALIDGAITVTPMMLDGIQPNSIDLRLDPHIKISTPDGFRDHHLFDDGPIRMHQGVFVLGATLEWVEITNGLVGFLDGKSSRAREGIQVHSAGLIDSGWKGNLTLEITMLAPLPNVWLMAGMQITQLRIEQSSSPSDRPYGSDGLGSRYQGSTGPVESRALIGRPS